MRCANCGLSLQEGDARCPRCAGLVNEVPFPTRPPEEPETPPYGLAPTPAAPARRGGSGIPAPVVGLVLLMGIVGVAITLVVKQHAAATPAAPAEISSVASPPSAPALPPASAVEPTPSSSEPEQPPDNASAKADLDNEVDQDRDAAEALVGDWVPQLSSKRPGLVADGITYDYSHIWANFQQLKSEYPTALLLWSGDYVSFKSPNFYVTVVAQPSPDGPSANEWCDEAELPPDDCYAKFLSHEGGPSGTTLLRH